MCAPRRIERVWLAALVAVVCLGGDGEATAPDARLAAVQARYADVRDIRASFEQQSFVASLGREESSRGRVVVVRPGRMRWEYTEPTPSVIVVDGEAVRLYDPTDKKLQIVPLGAGALSPTALGFLLGESRLDDTFTVAPEGPAGAAEREGELGLKLVPREDAGFEYLELWLERGSYRLRESVLQDLFGNRTRVRFRDVVENAGTEEVAFTIRVPDDTEVIDLR